MFLVLNVIFYFVYFKKLFSPVPSKEYMFVNETGRVRCSMFAICIVAIRAKSNMHLC